MVAKYKWNVNLKVMKPLNTETLIVICSVSKISNTWWLSIVTGYQLLQASSGMPVSVNNACSCQICKLYDSIKSGGKLQKFIKQ